MQIRAYNEQDVPAMIRIWNEVVEDGVAFPQDECLDAENGNAFFASQTYCGVAENTRTKEILGLCDYRPKTAIVMIENQVDAEKALQELNAAHGHVSKAICKKMEK